MGAVLKGLKRSSPTGLKITLRSVRFSLKKFCLDQAGLQVYHSKSSVTNNEREVISVDPLNGETLVESLHV